MELAKLKTEKSDDHKFRHKFILPNTLSAQPTACPKQYNSPSDPPKREPKVCAIKK